MFRIPKLHVNFCIVPLFTQNNVSAGVRRETIVFLEKGRYNPSLKLADDIAATFGERIEDVFLFGD
jgi:DNA-binding XRE family transcriptional regulator